MLHTLGHETDQQRLSTSVSLCQVLAYSILAIFAHVNDDPTLKRSRPLEPSLRRDALPTQPHGDLWTTRYRRPLRE